MLEGYDYINYSNMFFTNTMYAMFEGYDYIKDIHDVL